GRLVQVEVLDELHDAALEQERVGAAVALVLDDDLQSSIEEGELAQPVRQRVERQVRFLEDRRVGLEADDGAVLRGFLARRERAVGMQDHLDRVAEDGERLVDGVVDDLVYQMMQAVRARVADVHGGTLAHRLEAFEDLDVTRGIRLCAHAAATSPASTIHRAAPFTASGSGDVRNTCSALWISCRTLAPTTASSSDSASSSSSTGGVPAASVTGKTSASRSASASSRCSPREPKARTSVPSSSMARSSRCGPASVSRRRNSSARRRSSAASSAAGSVASPRLVRYATWTLRRVPASAGYTRPNSVESAATARRRRSINSIPIAASCSSHGASRLSASEVCSS